APHGRFRDYQQTGRNQRTKGNADARTTGRRSADDTFRLELRSHRLDPVVTSPTDPDQHPDGVLRRLPSGRAVSRLAALVDSNHYPGARDRSHDRDDEAGAPP